MARSEKHWVHRVVHRGSWSLPCSINMAGQIKIWRILWTQKLPWRRANWDGPWVQVRTQVSECAEVQYLHVWMSFYRSSRVCVRVLRTSAVYVCTCSPPRPFSHYRTSVPPYDSAVDPLMHSEQPGTIIHNLLGAVARPTVSQYWPSLSFSPLPVCSSCW